MYPLFQSIVIAWYFNKIEFIMRLYYLAFALLPLGLAACQSNQMDTVRDQTVQIVQQQNAKKTLTAYTWSLDTGTTKPMQLNFHQDGRLSISTSCNSISTAWTVANNELTTGNSMMTQMACPPAAMQQEQLAIQLFDKQKASFVLDAHNPQQPTLTFMDQTGKRYTFQGKMTPETKYQGQGETIFLEVSPETKSCTGVAPQTCLQVREIKYNEQGLKTYQAQNWSLFYDTIEGYQHTSKERQVIRVKRYTLKNPAADQSKYAYVHDMTIEREAVKGSL